jgi:hypothetical protein
MELRSDRVVVLAAVNKEGYAIHYASLELRNDHEIDLIAVSKSNVAMTHVSHLEHMRCLSSPSRGEKHGPSTASSASGSTPHVVIDHPSNATTKGLAGSKVSPTSVSALEYVSNELRHDKLWF